MKEDTVVDVKMVKFYQVCLAFFPILFELFQMKESFKDMFKYGWSNAWTIYA